jgi:hypothetical protein
VISDESSLFEEKKQAAVSEHSRGEQSRAEDKEVESSERGDQELSSSRIEESSSIKLFD